MSINDSDKLNIVLASDAHRVGGAEHYLYLLAKGLKDNGHRVRLLCPARQTWDDAASSFGKIGVNVRREDISNKADWGRCHFLSHKNGSQNRRLKKIFPFLASGSDICHINTANIENGHLLILAAASAGIKNIVTTVHTDDFTPYVLKQRPLPFIDAFRRRTVRHVTSRVQTIIAVSKTTRNGLIREYGLEPEKIAVVHNGVSLLSLSPDRTESRQKISQETGTNSGGLYILCVAHLLREKGLDILLKSLKVLKERHLSFHCFIAGEGPFKQALENIIDDHELRADVSLIGARHDVPDLLCASDIFVLPSLSEGFPFVVLEAMAAGLPCVVTRVGGLPEMISDGDDGLLVDSGNERALTQSLERIITDPALRRHCGERAKRKVESRFGLETMVSETEKVYRSILFKSAREVL